MTRHDPKVCAHCLDLKHEEMSDDDPAVRAADFRTVADLTSEEIIGRIMAIDFHPIVPGRKR